MSPRSFRKNQRARFRPFCAVLCQDCGSLRFPYQAGGKWARPLPRTGLLQGSDLQGQAAVREEVREDTALLPFHPGSREEQEPSCRYVPITEATGSLPLREVWPQEATGAAPKRGVALGTSDFISAVVRKSLKPQDMPSGLTFCRSCSLPQPAGAPCPLSLELIPTNYSV